MKHHSNTIVGLAVLLALCHFAFADADTLRTEQTYFGLDRLILIEVAPPRSTESADDQTPPLQLVILDVEGRAIRGPASVRGGRVDLAHLFEDIWSIRRSSYLQALHHGSPAGSALVLQPMLVPRVPSVQVTTRPAGTVQQRIVGWSIPGVDPDEPPFEPAFTGFRIYPDRDVVLHTSEGAIRLAMRPDEAPNTVWNFRELVRGGFYRDVIFHRIVPLDRDGHPFVIQVGDPLGTGRGGPGYTIPLEPSDIAHDFGVISMARTDEPDSAGSQFFICLSRAGTARLDGQYTAFSHAVEGVEAILAIEDVELADPETGRPVDPPVLERAELIPAPPRIPGRGRPDQPVQRPVEELDPRPGRVPR